MELNYKYAESTIKPLTIEFSKNCVYLRRNINEEVRVNEDDINTTIYTYEEVWMTPDDFNVYASQIKAENAIKGVNDSSNILNLLTGQKNGDDNQLAIMEAIAFLYETIIEKGGSL